mgnify:CR=1 FL=1
MSYFKPIGISQRFSSSASQFLNFHIERVATDPTDSDRPGREWYNTTEKMWKRTTLDANGAVIIEAAPSRAEFAALVATDAAQAQSIADLQAASTAATAAIAGLNTSLGPSYLKLDGTNAMNGSLNWLVIASCLLATLLPTTKRLTAAKSSVLSVQQLLHWSQLMR